MLDQLVSNTVYSFMHPMVRSALKRDNVDLPELFRSVSDGRFDRWHRGIVDRYVDWIAPDAPGIRSFPLSYCTPTMGSEEAIREIMTHLKEVENADRIYVLKGEYEGYAAIAGTRGLPCMVLTLDGLLDAPSGWVFLSNPSAIDGNLLPAETVTKIFDRHKVIYDLAYLGTCETGTAALTETRIDLEHRNIHAVLTSFSKPFGMFYYRVGFAFTRFDLPVFMANRRWFKNVPGLAAADAVIRGVDRVQMRLEMYAAQDRALEALDNAGYVLRASDSYLMAHTDLSRASPAVLEDLSLYRRGDGYRLCLTPSFERMFRDS